MKASIDVFIDMMDVRFFQEVVPHVIPYRQRENCILLLQVLYKRVGFLKK